MHHNTRIPLHQFDKLGYSDKLDQSLPLLMAVAKVSDHRCERPLRDHHIQVGYYEWVLSDNARTCRSAWDEKYGPISLVFTIDGAEFNKIQAWTYLTKGVGFSSGEAHEFLDQLPIQAG